MALINTPIKPFTAQAFHNGEYVEVTEKDVLGKWAIFFFYPADFTFVCPTELGDLADQYDELQKLGVEVYSVSTDTHHVHAAWHKESETVGKSYASYHIGGHQWALPIDAATQVQAIRPDLHPRPVLRWREVMEA